MTLGKFATQFVLHTEIGITRLHGTIERAGRFIVVPMYHPAAAIYDRNKVETLHEDFAMLGNLLKDDPATREREAARQASESREDGDADKGDPADPEPVQGHLL